MNEKLLDGLKLYYLSEDAKGRSFTQLLNMFPEYDADEIEDTLSVLQEEGFLVKTSKKKKYVTPAMVGLKSGKISINKKGFGFVDTGEEGHEDVFISPKDLGSAMNGDMVVIDIIKEAKDGKNPEGYVKIVAKRGTASVVGRYQRLENFGFVIPLSQKISQDIFISKKEENGARNGDFVKCEITKFPEDGKNPEGIISMIIGDESDKDIYFKSLLAEYNLQTQFPVKVQEEALKVPEMIDKKNFPDRLDLTDKLIFTIDGFDAKDLDDAISIERVGDNYRLGVHIADVSEYVKEGSAIDDEALNRATSVYLVNTVIPMLPEELSNGICSLHQGVDRLALSCIMDINKSGKVISSKVAKSIINSSARLVYDTVSDYIEDAIENNMDKELLESLNIAHELAKILMKAKEERGAMDFSFPESVIIMDEKGDVTDVFAEQRRIANRIIEEFMLITNETIAEKYTKLRLPFVYRVHETPTLEKINSLSETLRIFDYSLKPKDDIKPKELQQMLKDMEGKKEEQLIQTLTLRSLQKARYSKDALGHFSLALKDYCHFTSPIRRYPDLQIHRIIKKHMDGEFDKKETEALETIVADVSEQSSFQEERANEVERDVDDLRKTQYMTRFIGEEFEGMISSITGFGIFVMLENTVEGLVRIADMEDDYYDFDETNYRLVGERSGKTYRVGDRVRIAVVNAVLETRKIEFVLVEEENGDK